MPRFYKLHTIIDADTKELADLRVTRDRCHDNRKFIPMVGESASKGDTVYADGAYDTWLFQFVFKALVPCIIYRIPNVIFVWFRFSLITLKIWIKVLFGI